MTLSRFSMERDVNWLNSPRVLESSIERLKTIKALDLDTALDFHDCLHKCMAKSLGELAKALEPHRPLFLEEPLFSEHPDNIKSLSGLVSCPIALSVRTARQPLRRETRRMSELRRIVVMVNTYDVALAPRFFLGMNLGIQYNQEAGEYDITS
ncbi:hypothetical protein P170DRAFT_477645 [Aspergillus steynii IBT 23096]|uniref:Uncharacterized protein n=1 Tax=Aspergillus steynii IBT 23096 TaxID=1392250 RepID=A0A2I2G1N0_9EURO|nr:uncharacterized protein P170DRAFT_477645 [Aspergillus steynii IBT 23096]PLB46776.1 hypothetical protein P170DRAFT_477645 [Aspergillus steynii IBT 23096]